MINIQYTYIVGKKYIVMIAICRLFRFSYGLTPRYCSHFIWFWTIYSTDYCFNWRWPFSFWWQKLKPLHKSC